MEERIGIPISFCTTKAYYHKISKSTGYFNLYQARVQKHSIFLKKYRKHLQKG